MKGDMISVVGYEVSPREVEEGLLLHSAIAEAATPKEIITFYWMISEHPLPDRCPDLRKIYWRIFKLVVDFTSKSVPSWLVTRQEAMSSDGSPYSW
jgi:hypothetical protein